MAMTADWAGQHSPILSSAEKGHLLYTRFKRWEPNGLLVRCHQNCPEEVRIKDGNKNTIRFICTGCDSRCSLQKSVTNLDMSTRLGKHALVKTIFPRGQYPTPRWELPEKNDTHGASAAGTLSQTTTQVETPSHRPVLPEVVVRSNSLPLPSIVTTGPASPSSSIPLSTRPPLNVSSTMSRSKSTSSMVGAATTGISHLPHPDLSQDDLRKRQPAGTSFPKTVKRQKRK